MRSLARPVFTLAGTWPVSAAAQAATDTVQTGRSAWNWVIGIAALLVVIVLARLILGRRAAARRP